MEVNSNDSIRKGVDLSTRETALAQCCESTDCTPFIQPLATNYFEIVNPTKQQEFTFSDVRTLVVSILGMEGVYMVTLF